MVFSQDKVMDDFGFVVVHVPHASFEIPPEYKESILLDDKSLEREMMRMTDAFCDELYDAPEFQNRVVAKYSRFVCDVERFRNDEDEPRFKYGQGLMYTRTTFGRRLRRLDGSLREKILRDVYDPHHECLTNAVDEALRKYGKCLIIDGHSFPSFTIAKPLGILCRPDFDIGTDSFHTPPGLCDAVMSRARALGYKVKQNTPFAGAITPMKHYKKDSRVSSIMIETNRRLYMTRELKKSPGFEKTRESCIALMRTAAEYVMR